VAWRFRKKFDRFIRRRSFLQILLGTSVAIAAIAISKLLDRDVEETTDSLEPALKPERIDTTVALKQYAADRGLLYGAAVRYPDFFSNPDLRSVLARDAQILVPEWELKWAAGEQPLRPSPDRFDFSRADRMAEYAKEHNLLFRGHALVWHEALPEWFSGTVNRQNARQFLIEHIKTTVGRYAGKMHSWDVVNEAIAVEDRLPNGWRKTPWLEFLGEDYIDLAFRTAAKADPNALLVYNDYGMEYDNEYEEARRTAILKLLEHHKAKGTPIQALGIQAHLFPKSDHQINPKQLRQFFRNVADLGLKIMITELDVTDEQLPIDIEQRDRAVAKAYREYLSIALAEPAVISVITWGSTDRYTWLSEVKPRKDGAALRPLPLDNNLQPKLAWQAMARTFKNAPRR
jgi:endo-1,4-beta-xylanase